MPKRQLAIFASQAIRLWKCRHPTTALSPDTLVIDGCDFLDYAFYILQNTIHMIIIHNMDVEWFIRVFHIDKSL